MGKFGTCYNSRFGDLLAFIINFHDFRYYFLNLI